MKVDVKVVQGQGRDGRRSRARWTALAALGLAVAAAGDARAQSTSSCTPTGNPVVTSTHFGAGSLVIPMDTCYNPDTSAQSGGLDSNGSCVANASRACYNSYGGGDLRLPFGLIYLLTENNIPVSIILNNTKLGLGDADFSITPTSGGTTNTAYHLLPSSSGYTIDSTGMPCGTHTVSYSGMPFVVDATYAQQALQVITSFDNANGDLFKAVTLHVSNYPFTAPVLAVLQSRPKPVIVDGSPLDTYFSESQIPAVAASGSYMVSLNGSSPSYTFNWPSSLPSNPACPGGVCSALTYTSNGSTRRVVDVVWDQLGASVANWSAMPSFMQNGGVALVVDAAQSWESGSGPDLGGITNATTGNESSPYCAAMAVSNSNPFVTPGPTSEYPASDRFLQIDLYNMDVHGNGGGADGASGYTFSSAPPAYTHGLSNGDVPRHSNTGTYEAVTGHPFVNNTQTAGSLVYLGSLNSWHGNSSNKDGGLHVMYNTLLAGGTGCGDSPYTATELTRSDAVFNTLTSSSGSTSLTEYQGTFDWKIPSDATSGGNMLYEPDATQYPYTTGHFREYKQPGTYTVDSSTTYTTCSASSSHSACNWDAATLMKPVASRRIYVVTGSAGSWQLTPIASVNNSTVNYVRTHLDTTDSSGNAIGKLGGIDYGTAAVIEAATNSSVTVTGASTRPMIAYVGARDGMLHAFCVQPPTGQSKCYGLAAAGEELWAIITPGALNRMRDAYNNGVSMDWSKVNMGGAVRVADVKDTFEGSSGYRTIALIGSRDSGFVDAIDITNPDPGQLSSGTSIGFSFLWENDGTTVDATYVSTPTSQTVMGPTAGGTIAPMGQGAAVAVVTAASCNGNPTLRNQVSTQTACASSVANGVNTYLLRLSDGAVVGFDAEPYTRTSSLFGTAIPNDVPALPTTLDYDGDGIYESAFVGSFDGAVRKYTLKANAVSPTWGVFDSTKPRFTIFDASSSCSGGYACEPIGTSPTLLVNTTNGPKIGVMVVTGGADWARTATDKGDLTATTNLFHVYGFDASKTSATTAYVTRTLGGVTPPVSSAAGSATAALQSVPLSLRGYAALTVSGTDLYADVTSVSVNTVNQLVQLVMPEITPGSWGATLRWQNASSGTGLDALATNLSGSNSGFAGGASSIVATSINGNAVTFVTSFSGTVSGLSAPASTAPNSAYSVNQYSGAGSGTRNFSVLTWFDL